MIRGKHAITVGVDIRRLREFEQDNYLGNGTLSFEWRVHGKLQCAAATGVLAGERRTLGSATPSPTCC